MEPKMKCLESLSGICGWQKEPWLACSAVFRDNWDILLSQCLSPLKSTKTHTAVVNIWQSNRFTLWEMTEKKDGYGPKGLYTPTLYKLSKLDQKSKGNHSIYFIFVRSKILEFDENSS